MYGCCGQQSSQRWWTAVHGAWWLMAATTSWLHRPCCCDRLCEMRRYAGHFDFARPPGHRTRNRLGKKQKHQTEISRSLNKFPGTDDDYLANVFRFPKSGPAPVVIWNDWNFFNIYKNSHVCYFSIWFYFLEGGLTPAAIFPLASAQSSFLSLWCNFFPKLSFTEWTSFFSLLILKNFPRLDWLDCALFLGSFG